MAWLLLKATGTGQTPTFDSKMDTSADIEAPVNNEYYTLIYKVYFTADGILILADCLMLKHGRIPWR
jgi:hypothetical protein